MLVKILLMKQDYCYDSKKKHKGIYGTASNQEIKN